MTEHAMQRAGAYRVFSCDGSNTDDVIIAAAERALADGMDVINMCEFRESVAPMMATVESGKIRLPSRHGPGLIAAASLCCGADEVGKMLLRVECLQAS